MTRPVKPQTSIQLSAYIVKAFVSPPIRKSRSGRWPYLEESKDKPTDGQPSLVTLETGGQKTQDFINVIFVSY